MAKVALIAAIVAIVGYLVYDRYFSRNGRIEAVYRGCMKEVGAVAVPPADKPPANANDPAAALAKGMGEAMTAMLQGAGSAMCGVVRDQCNKDFDGQICQAAIRRYR
jgi:hypothetical protein